LITLSSRIEIDIQETILPLNQAYRKELFDLVDLVQPGYFRNRTADMGDYFGIFKEHQLVSVAGERMKMNDFIEVSAIVTHPDHTGKGYARQLTAYTANSIFDKSLNPYLHVAATNTKAISLYEKLGFRMRRKISFWNFMTSSRIKGEQSS
jgi:predicted GNAT family acetyltransferase